MDVSFHDARLANMVNFDDSALSVNSASMGFLGTHRAFVDIGFVIPHRIWPISCPLPGMNATPQRRPP